MLKVLAECVLVSRGGYSADDEEEDEDRFVSIEGHDHTSAHIQVVYFLKISSSTSDVFTFHPIIR